MSLEDFAMLKWPFAFTYSVSYQHTNQFLQRINLALLKQTGYDIEKQWSIIDISQFGELKQL